MWLYVLIAVGSLPVLTTVIGVPWVFYAEWRRNRRIAAMQGAGERRLSDRWLADQVWDGAAAHENGFRGDNDPLFPMPRMQAFGGPSGAIPVDDLGQASNPNPRARP